MLNTNGSGVVIVAALKVRLHIPYRLCPRLHHSHHQIYTDSIDTMLNFDGAFDGHGHGDGKCKQAL